MIATSRRVAGRTFLLLLLVIVLSTLAVAPAQAIGVGCSKGCRESVPSTPIGDVYE